MHTGVLAFVKVGSERIAALTAAGYVIHDPAKYPSRAVALRDTGDDAKVVITDGRGSIAADQMALLPKFEIICAIGAGYEAVGLGAAQMHGIAVTHGLPLNADVSR